MVTAYTEQVRLPTQEDLEKPLDATFHDGAECLLVDARTSIIPREEDVRAVGYYLQAGFNQLESGGAYAEFFEGLPYPLHGTILLDTIRQASEDSRRPKQNILARAASQLGFSNLLEQRSASKAREAELHELQERAKRNHYAIEVTDFRVDDKLVISALHRHSHYDVSSELSGTVIGFETTEDNIPVLVIELAKEERESKFTPGLLESFKPTLNPPGSVIRLTGTAPLDRLPRGGYSGAVLADYESKQNPQTIVLGETLQMINENGEPTTYGVFCGFVDNQVVELDQLSVNGIEIFPDREWVHDREAAINEYDRVRKI